MKKFEIELENGLLLRIRNIDDEVVVTYDDGRINLLSLNNVINDGKCLGGEMILDTHYDDERERRARFDRMSVIKDRATAAAYMDDVLERKPSGTFDKVYGRNVPPGTPRYGEPGYVGNMADKLEGGG